MTGRFRRVALGTAVLLTVLAGPVASAPGDPTVRFSAAGDFSASSAATSVFNLIGSLDNDFHAALGDMSYGTTGAEEAWCNRGQGRRRRGLPVRAGLGQPREQRPERQHQRLLGLPAQPAARAARHLRPAVLRRRARQRARWCATSPSAPASRSPTGTLTYAAGTPQYTWTSAAIDGARAAGIPWVVVGNHTPCLSLGEYACEMGSDLANLLLAKKVDLVLNGHEHIYQRTKQLDHARRVHDARAGHLQRVVRRRLRQRPGRRRRHGLRHGRHRRDQPAQRQHRRPRGRLLRRLRRAERQLHLRRARLLGRPPTC